MQTRLSSAPPTGPYDPPPPDDRLYVAVVSGELPPRTRDGRDWAQAFGSLPDPYVRVLVNDGELFRTESASDTLEPTWPTSPKGNFKLGAGDRIEVQLWAAAVMNDKPIGVKKLTLTPDMIAEHEIELDLSGDAKVKLLVEPAHPIWGAGFWFELRNSSSYVTRLVDASPASRAGMVAGDRIVALGGKPVDQMSTDEVRSTLGAFPVGGVAMTLQHGDGTTLQVTVKEGPIYPLFSEYKSLGVTPP
jgi:hypothetical protein